MQDKGIYTFSSENNDDEESGYESAGGTKYKKVGEIANGKCALAEEFQSINPSTEDKVKAILKPLPKNARKTGYIVDYEEAQRKYHFFNTLYPNQGVQLIKGENTYRLVLPLIIGSRYQELSPRNEEEARKIFLAAVIAINDCHQKGLVIIDLKEDNILLNEQLNKAYLIDGGSSTQLGQKILEGFITNTQEQIDQARKKYSFYAPECFDFQQVLVSKAMDVYSLGSMMNFIIPDNILCS